MDCKICNCSIDPQLSHIQCHICGDSFHIDCLEDRLKCPMCKQNLNPFYVIEHMTIQEFKDWLQEFIDNRVKEFNSKLDASSQLVKVYIDRCRKMRKSQYRMLLRLKKTLDMFDIDENIKNKLDTLALMYKQMSELSEKIGVKRTAELLDVSMNLHVIDDDIKDVFIKSEDEQKFVYNASNCITIGTDIKNRYSFIVPNETTDVNALDVLEFALQKGVIVNFDDDILLYPDSEGIARLQRIRHLFETNFSTFNDFISETPSFITQAIDRSITLATIKTNVWDDKFEATVFNRCATEVFTFDAEQKFDAVNVCEKCGSRVNSDFKCGKCKTQYCKECMKELCEGHKCNTDDVTNWKTIQLVTKACPICGTRIEKASGCNDMFCTKCHKGFDYASGAIKEGAFHNPERSKWLKETSQSNDTLSSVFREFTIEDQKYFFSQMLKGFRKNNNAYYTYVDFLNDIKSIKLDPYKLSNTLQGMYHRRFYTDLEPSLNLFLEEMKWFITEVLMRFGDAIERFNDRTSVINFSKGYEFIINGSTVFELLCDALDDRMPIFIRSLLIGACDGLTRLIRNTDVSINLRYTNDNAQVRKIDTQNRMKKLRRNKVFINNEE